MPQGRLFLMFSVATTAGSRRHRHQKEPLLAQLLDQVLRTVLSVQLLLRQRQTG
jgi:hypothetical protein